MILLLSGSGSWIRIHIKMLQIRIREAQNAFATDPTGSGSEALIGIESRSVTKGNHGGKISSLVPAVNILSSVQSGLTNRLLGSLI